MAELSPSDVQAALTPEKLRTFQIIYFALGTGVTFFWGLVVVLHFMKFGAAHPEGYSLARTLSLIHAFFAAGAYGLGPLVQRGILQAAARGDAETAVNGIWQSMLVRLVIMEGAAYFGLVVCLVGVTYQLMNEHPLLWLNSISTGIMLAYAARTFPTAERFQDVFAPFGIARV